jgi:hypothetical protein
MRPPGHLSVRGFTQNIVCRKVSQIVSGASPTTTRTSFTELAAVPGTSAAGWARAIPQAKNRTAIAAGNRAAHRPILAIAIIDSAPWRQAPPIFPFAKGITRRSVLEKGF